MTGASEQIFGTEKQSPQRCCVYKRNAHPAGRQPAAPLKKGISIVTITNKFLTAWAVALIIGCAAIGAATFAQQAVPASPAQAAPPASGQDRLERQGKAVCRQSLVKIAQLFTDAESATETMDSLIYKNWKQMSLAELELLVQATTIVVDAEHKGFAIMTLRKVNSCPKDVSERWDITDETIRTFDGILFKLQLQLTLRTS